MSCVSEETMPPATGHVEVGSKSCHVCPALSMNAQLCPGESCPRGAPSRTVLWWSCAEGRTGDGRGPRAGTAAGTGCDGGWDGRGGRRRGVAASVLGPAMPESSWRGVSEVLKSHVAAQPMLQDYRGSGALLPWDGRAHTRRTTATSESSLNQSGSASEFERALQGGDSGDLEAPGQGAWAEESRCPPWREGVARVS